MMISINQTVWGYQVAIDSPVRERLVQAVELLKAEVPKNCRRFQEGRYWFVDKRAEKKLRRFLDTLKLRLADVDIFEHEEASAFATACGNGGTASSSRR